MFNDFNGHFNSSCNVPVIEDQLLGDESKCDSRLGRRTSCSGAPSLVGWLAYKRTRHQSEGGPSALAAVTGEQASAPQGQTGSDPEGRG